MTQAAPEGWYHAQGDPDGTVRYWNGAIWIGRPTAPQDAHGDAPPTPKTGPNVHGRLLAEPVLRVLAATIDWIAVSALMIPMQIALETLPLNGYARWGRLGLLSMSFLAFEALYMIIPIWRWGATLGKRVVGIEVIDATNGRGAPGLRGAVLRHLPIFATGMMLRLIPLTLRTYRLLWPIRLTRSTVRFARFTPPGPAMLFFVISLMLIIRDGKRRSIADRAGNTFVVARR
jgi:uncharacterized RDD family membrane protein YckC